jgi:hypothetical protein
MAFANASASCCAALSSLSFQSRSSAVSVCLKKWVSVYGRNEERMRVTVFFAKASARSCAALSPIRSLRKFNAVSVCV